MKCKYCVRNNETGTDECELMIKERNMLVKKYPDRDIEYFVEVSEKDDCWYSPKKFSPVDDTS